MNIYGDKKAYCKDKINITSVYGETVYYSDVVIRGDSLVYKRGFCCGEVIPLKDEHETLINDFEEKNGNKEYLSKGLNIIDLLCYGKLEKVDGVFISDWFKKYRFIDGEELRISYDTKKRFGSGYIKNSYKTCIPFVEISEYGEMMIGMYSIDDDMVIVKMPLWDICFDGDEYVKYKRTLTDIIYGQK